MDIEKLHDTFELVGKIISSISLSFVPLAKFLSFLGFRGWNDRRKLSPIKEALESEILDESDKVYLSGMLRAKTFELATGIYAEDSLRSSIKSLYEKASGHISYDDIRRSQYDLKIRDGKLFVDSLTLEKVGFTINSTAVVSLFVFGFFTIFYGVFSKSLVPVLQLAYSGVGAVFIVIGALVSRNGLKYLSMRRVAKEIERQSVAR